MGYGQRGNKPFERASRIAHASVINAPEVRSLLSRCALPSAATTAVIADECETLPHSDSQPIRVIVAVDGGYTEAPVRDEYPSATVTFFTFGPLLFGMDDLEAIDRQPFIAPEDMATLRNLERYTLALPTRNVLLSGTTDLVQSVRRTIFEFMTVSAMGKHRLLDTLRWLLLRQWKTDHGTWTIPHCPNLGCTQRGIQFDKTTADVLKCPACHSDVFLSDALRLHERVDVEQGAGAICGYLMTSLEQLVLVHVIRTILGLKRSLLREVLLIKDGPLAFFGLTAPLHTPMRELCIDLFADGLHMVGLEKSGSFVEHAVAIEASLPYGAVLIPSNEYIYRYIEPGDSHSQKYGQNTYYSAKAIYRSTRGDTYVATLPTKSWAPKYRLSDIPNAAETLDALTALRCSMYDNALLPIALVNRLVSLSDVPSKEILAIFARKSLGLKPA